MCCHVQDQLKSVLPSDFSVAGLSRHKYEKLDHHNSNVGGRRRENSSVINGSAKHNSDKLLPQHGSGTGLGLNIAAKVLKQHDGIISLNSAGPNLGCTASFSIPIFEMTPRQRARLNFAKDDTESHHSAKHSSILSSRNSFFEEEVSENQLIDRMVEPISAVNLSSGPRDQSPGNVASLSSTSDQFSGVVGSGIADHHQSDQATLLSTSIQGISFDAIRTPGSSTRNMVLTSSSRSSSLREFPLLSRVSGRLKYFSNRKLDVVHPTPIEEEPAEPEEPPVNVSHWNRRVLVVDDSKLARSMICTMLRKLNFVYDEAANGLEAIELVTLSEQHSKPLHLNLPHIHHHKHEPNLSGILSSKDSEEVGSFRPPPGSSKSLHDGMLGSFEGGAVTVDNSNNDNPSIHETRSEFTQLTSDGLESIADIVDGDIEDQATSVAATNRPDVHPVVPPRPEHAGRTYSSQLTTPSSNSEQQQQPQQPVVHKSFGYCFILIDSVMPKLEGPAAVREIRQLGYEGPIFGVTGNTLPTDITTFMNSGLTELLPKPLRFQPFKAILQQYNLD